MPNPLRAAKRHRYTSLHPAADSSDDDDLADIEKRHSLDEFDRFSTPSSAYSSRASSGVQQPMFPSSQRRSSSASRKAHTQHNAPSFFAYRGPRRFSRYFTFVLGSIIVVFILTLTRLSWASARNVELGLGRSPPKPPIWEAFPFLKRYHGGIRTLVPKELNVPEYPRKGDEVAAGEEAQAGEPYEEVAAGGLPPSQIFHPYGKKEEEGYGAIQECFLDEEKRRIPRTRVYNGVVKGQPDNIMGSYELLGLRNDVCFERYGRLGPYGYGYSRKLGGSGAGMEGDREGVEQIWEDGTEVDFRAVSWKKVQDRCLTANEHRFKAKPKGRNHSYQAMADGGPDPQALSSESGSTKELLGTRGDTERSSSDRLAALMDATSNNTVPVRSQQAPDKLLLRTAILIRTWHDYQYDDEDLIFLRSLISELTIHSGGEYVLHFLIHVKDDNLPIWSDDATHQRVLDDSLPKEFRGMGTLWTERQMGLLYGGLEESFYRNLPVHGAYRSTFMPVQYFAHQHPEYDFFWHWEMDVRYTGHYYHLLSQISSWAKQQPRKGLWERNTRFYVPSEHGTWDDFKHMVRVQTEHGTNSKANIWADLAAKNPNIPDSVKNEQLTGPEKPIWGPEPPLDNELADSSNDPVPPHSYKEDQDTWGVGEDADLITFNPLFDPAGTNWILAEDVTGYNTTRGLPPRRTVINTTGRLSRRLLLTMHAETALKRHSMFSEMWPGTVALHHGYKAVYAPHPVFIDRRWPTALLAATFNGGRNGAAGGARTSVFSDERQHNFIGSSWYYHSGFAPNLWKRWLGFKVDNDGGEEFEEAFEGRMCLPGILLHPVKQVDLVFEHTAEEA
ncbi:hypothetical protein W97_01938 [Coniosporium apollinis CBS 100218]|uniref:Major facilitator superfamily transporter n=1 Tax=Coniosporium apollinis (strain CBS 100218) TaxID=1168221 RepID=R7YLN0_CONA1|nr:uncharacterized protein W97_01938 [Coniosporium apollinis CBS 100218]EON62714.1 hypothetical protein W97_01938 [Coniosporium apollinis CBS 100218]